MFGFAKVEDADDMGILDLEAEFCLSPKGLDRSIALGRAKRHTLDDTRLRKKAVPSQKDLAHTALVDALLKLITTQTIRLTEKLEKKLMQPSCKGPKDRGKCKRGIGEKQGACGGGRVDRCKRKHPQRQHIQGPDRTRNQQKVPPPSRQKDAARHDQKRYQRSGRGLPSAKIVSADDSQIQGEAQPTDPFGDVGKEFALAFDRNPKPKQP